MNLLELSETLRNDAVPVVFLNVLLQQLGLPVPAVPTLLLAGSLVITPESLGPLIMAATAASVFADWVWYWSGRMFGYRVLSGLCKLSINPSSCVTQTETRFVRWGLSSLVIAKFIPGFSTVAPPIAGALRMSLSGFLLASGIGAGLWAGVALVTGLLLQDTVRTVITLLDQNSHRAFIVIALLLSIWIGWKFWQKYRFRKFGAVPHITPIELLEAMSSDTPPLLLDLRGPAMVKDTGPVFGATIADFDFLHQAVTDWPKASPVVTFCACPEDASAIKAAKMLLDLGYLNVRPLKGGYNAWMEVTNQGDFTPT